MVLLKFGLLSIALGLCYLYYKRSRRSSYRANRELLEWVPLNNWLIVDATDKPAPGALILGRLTPVIGDTNSQRFDIPAKIAARHMLLIGESGSGKSRANFMPNIANYQGSFIVFDPFGEYWRETSTAVTNPIALDLFEGESRLKFNWLTLFPRLGDKFVDAILQNVDVPNDISELKSFLQIILLHISDSDNPTPLAAYQFVKNNTYHEIIEKMSRCYKDRLDSKFLQRCRLISRLNPDCPELLHYCALQALSWINDKTIIGITSTSHTAPDFRRIRQEKGSIYIRGSKQGLGFLSNKGMEILLSLLYIYAFSEMNNTQSLLDRLPVALFLDNFSLIGAIPNLTVEMNVLSYSDVSMMSALQSSTDLYRIYQDREVKLFLEKFYTKVFLPGRTSCSDKFIHDSLPLRIIDGEVVEIALPDIEKKEQLVLMNYNLPFRVIQAYYQRQEDICISSAADPISRPYIAN